MNCDEFKRCWIQGDADDLATDTQIKAIEHFHSCQRCSDAALADTLIKRGVNVADYPCVHMAQYAEFYCEHHHDPAQCEDAVIRYNAIFDEYSLPHGDGISLMTIQHCPWCGTSLPDSRRDDWFAALEALGFDDPWNQSIPEAFQTKQWRE